MASFIIEFGFCIQIFKQLLDEAKYDLNNYGNRGGCCPQRPITTSNICVITQIRRQPNPINVLFVIQNDFFFKNMLTSIDVKFPASFGCFQAIRDANVS